MQIVVKTNYVESLKKTGALNSILFDELFGYACRTLSNKIHKLEFEIDISDLKLDELKALRDALKAVDCGVYRSVSQLINALEQPDVKKVGSLDQFCLVLPEYLRARGMPWLFSLSEYERSIAYLPVSVYKREGNLRTGQEPSVLLIMHYNYRGKLSTRNVFFANQDMHLSVPEILKRHKLIVASEEMMADYQKCMNRYNAFLGMHSEQFRVKGIVDTEEESYRSRSINLSVLGRPSKAVLDIDQDDSGRPKMPASMYDNKMCSVPTHPLLPVFSLSHHCMVSVHVANMAPYEYEEGLTEKLVLPKSHSRLISALVSNLDLLRDANAGSQVLKAKSQSSIILAKGLPGTGKTLTAEVYCEEIKRPLYEVQSGQLGTTPSEVEENLGTILERSIRLNMPLLINEADVFVKTRGDDLEQNAVVAVFLRLLEYHAGLVWLTTNIDNIDDAIRSRCIAEIVYRPPDNDKDRIRLWKVQLREFSQTMSEAELKEIVQLFPNAVGRDIQNLISLTVRVCKSLNEPFGVSALVNNAVFRGLSPARV